MDVVQCNKEQAEKILKMYFSQKPKVVRVSKDDEDGIYFITAQTAPHGLRTEWQFRGSPENGSACFGEIRKGDRRYDLSYGYPEELMKPLNDACRRAILEYEAGGDIFLEEEVEEKKELTKDRILKSVRGAYDIKLIILFLIWLILLIISLFI